MYKSTAFLFLFALVISVAMIACNGDNGTGNPNPNPNPGPNTVTVNDNFFSPAQMTVSKGTTVTWQWVGNASHTVTSGEPGDNNAGSIFDQGPMSSGSFQFTFNNTGTFRYFCRIHGAMMEGTITVQ